MANQNKSNKKKTSGKGGQQVPIKPIDGIFLYQVNVCFKNGKRKEFIQHLAENYYGKSDRFNDCDHNSIIKSLELLMPESKDYGDNEERKVKLPLIAQKQDFFGSKRYESKSTGYYTICLFRQWEPLVQ